MFAKCEWETNTYTKAKTITNSRGLYLPYQTRCRSFKIPCRRYSFSTHPPPLQRLFTCVWVCDTSAVAWNKRAAHCVCVGDDGSCTLYMVHVEKLRYRSCAVSERSIKARVLNPIVEFIQTFLRHKQHNVCGPKFT